MEMLTSRLFRYGYVLIFSGVAMVIYVLQYFKIELPNVVDHYLNDVLCMPIILGITQFLIQQIKSNPHLKLPLALCIIVTIFYSVLFEVWLPSRNERYTADILDVVAYAIGLLFFIGIEKIKFREKTI